MTVGEITGQTQTQSKKKNHPFLRSLAFMLFSCVIGVVVVSLWKAGEPDFPSYLVNPLSGIVTFLTYMAISIFYELQTIQEKIDSLTKQ